MSNVSLEYLESLFNKNSGIPTLDENGKLLSSVIPDVDVKAPFLGTFSDLTVLAANLVDAPYGYYALLNGVAYYYNEAMSPPAWTSEQITAAAYKSLSPEAKAGQPSWVIVP